MVASLYSRRVRGGPKGTDMNELSTLLLDEPTATQTAVAYPASTPPAFTQAAFTQNGRKGVSYDWQSLLDAETLIALDLDLELATAYAE